MRRRPLPPGHQATPLTIRLAWWAAFLATLALVFAITEAKSASAAILPAPLGGLTGTAFVEPDEDPGAEEFEAEEEGWEDEEECEAFGEDEEEAFCEEPDSEEGTPPECLLGSAEATVSAIPARGTVRLQIRYTARSAAAVKVEYRLRGGKGSLSLGEDHTHFDRAGTFRSSERLTEARMEKVVAARTFTVELQAVNTPRYCHGYFDQKLTVKRASGGSFIWSEPAARATARARG